MAESLWFKQNENAANKTVTDTANAHNMTSFRNTQDFNATGKINGSLDYNGSSDYASVAYNSGVHVDFRHYSVNWSLAFWIKPKDLAKAGFQTIFGGIQKPYSQYEGAWAWLDAGGRLNVSQQTSSGTGHHASVSGKLLDDRWDHVVITKAAGADTNNFKFYINSVLTSHYTHKNRSYGTQPPQVTLGLGARMGSGPAEYFEGELDDVRLFDSVLTQAEVNKLFYAGDGTETALASITLPSSPGKGLLAGLLKQNALSV